MPELPEGTIENLQDFPIFVRSPYIINVNEPSQVEGKIEVFIWNENDPIPSLPTYTLAKKIPSSGNLLLTFNISNYVREFIQWQRANLNFNVTFDPTNPDEWAYVKIRRYYKTSASEFQLIDAKTYRAFDGYGYYEEGYNPDLSYPMMLEGAYDYYYDSSQGVPTTEELERYGQVVTLPTLDYQFRYTNLVTGAIHITTITAISADEPVVDSFLIYPPYAQDGNKVEYLDDIGTVLWTATFKPKEECKYKPVVVDFVNKWGAWQRTWFYKVSKRTLDVKKTEYNLLARDLINYDTYLPERKQFNVNGKTTIRVNTDWVEEEYNELVLKQMMLSEVILVDNKPAKLITSNTELFENINNHTINYELEFELTYDVINNVI